MDDEVTELYKESLTLYIKLKQLQYTREECMNKFYAERQALELEKLQLEIEVLKKTLR